MPIQPHHFSGKVLQQGTMFQAPGQYYVHIELGPIGGPKFESGTVPTL